MNRTCAEINLDYIRHNFNIVKKNTSALVMCVVKANAYGHGACMVSKTLQECGADYFAVADVMEGVELREGGITKPCLILGYSDDCQNVFEYDLIPSVFDYNSAKRLSEEAKKRNTTIKIHIALDTGMSRIGFKVNSIEDRENSLDEILKISLLDNIEIEGVFSHFSTADEENDEYTRFQFNSFLSFTDEMKARGIHFDIRHICNSAATMLYPDMHLEMVRPGIIIYGLNPSEYFACKNFGFIPAMEVKSIISRVTVLDEGTFVGYGNTFRTENKTKLATVSIGYADGYFRAFSNKGYGMYKGEKIKISGRICMDQCMFDVTNVNNISVGDHVMLFGKELSADDIASEIGTIGYELICAVGRRVPRAYYDNGKKIEEINFIMENIVR